MDRSSPNDLASPKCSMPKVATPYRYDFFSSSGSADGIGEVRLWFSWSGIFPARRSTPAQNDARAGRHASWYLHQQARSTRPTSPSTPEEHPELDTCSSTCRPTSAHPCRLVCRRLRFQVAADIANSATGIGFDASDLIPGKVSTGTSWTEMDNRPIEGGTNTDAILKAINDSWPTQ